ncbi:hypothetical protein ACWDWV_32800 [Streptosporangium sandarakinum]
MHEFDVRLIFAVDAAVINGQMTLSELQEDRRVLEVVDAALPLAAWGARMAP